MTEHVVEIARRWIGTPYVHQASVRRAGTDCLGLVRGVWREIHGGEPEAVPPYSSDWGEMGQDEILLAAAMRNLVALPPDAADQPGQVLLFRMREGAIAKHLGILAVPGRSASFIHAYDRHGVIESPFGRPWRARVVRRFRFP